MKSFQVREIIVTPSASGKWILTGSVEDAEDILQTIFLRLLAREFPPDLRKNPEPYLYRAAFNLSLNTLRQRKRHVLSGNMEVLADPEAYRGLVSDMISRGAVMSEEEMAVIIDYLYRTYGQK
jgi:DNA-directed RNA polymerase specialized sigma24 family protein